MEQIQLKSDEACVKASYTIEINECGELDCSNTQFSVSPTDCGDKNKQAVVSITVKAGKACGATRPALATFSPKATLFVIGSPRTALTIQSVAIRCNGNRPAVRAIGIKSLKLIDADISNCEGKQWYAVRADSGTPLTVTGGTWTSAGGATDRGSILVTDSDASTGTLLSVSGTRFTGSYASAVVDITKTTAKKLKASFKGCQMDSSPLEDSTDSPCLFKISRSDPGGQALTLDLTKSSFTGAPIQSTAWKMPLA